MSRLKGTEAEHQAARYLQSCGFKIIETNYYAKKFGEIDIIALKDEVYHFVEVKSGMGFEPIYNVTPSKLSKLIKSINYYLKVKSLDVAFSVDIITIVDDEIDLIENVTL